MPLISLSMSTSSANLIPGHDEALLRVLVTIRLAPEGAIRAKDISTQVLKSTSHTSRLIDRAEACKLIERRPDPSDRRAHRVVLTRKGEARIDAYVPHAIALLDRTYGEALSPGERKAFVDLLGRVEATAAKLVLELEQRSGGT
ncbi:MAG: winged helix-turn-helix transcriptional regulator [Myxococcales bacterium FL481]|nr:MAG: winged helix-turn-helix transcriptional regulator [Myxococcales bacterium FL481]